MRVYPPKPIVDNPPEPIFCRSFGTDLLRRRLVRNDASVLNQSAPLLDLL